MPILLDVTISGRSQKYSKVKSDTKKNPLSSVDFWVISLRKKNWKSVILRIFFCQMLCRLVIVNFFPFRILTENFLEDDVTSISFFRAFNLIFMRFLCEVEEAATHTHRDTGKTKLFKFREAAEIYFFVKSFSRNFSWNWFLFVCRVISRVFFILHYFFSHFQPYF